MTSLQESQTQLHHTQDALDEQHQKTLLLSQKVLALCRSRDPTDGRHSPSGELQDQALLEDPGGPLEGGLETCSSLMFSYQTPGLEILRCKYRAAVTEVVELKAEVKALKERLAEGEDKTRPPDQLDQLDQLRRQLSSSEQSCHDGHQKVTGRRGRALSRC